MERKKYVAIATKLQKAEGAAEEVNDALIFHFGKLAGESGAIDAEINGKRGSVKGNDEGTASGSALALRKKGDEAVADLRLA